MPDSSFYFSTNTARSQSQRHRTGEQDAGSETCQCGEERAGKRVAGALYFGGHEVDAHRIKYGLGTAHGNGGDQTET